MRKTETTNETVSTLHHCIDTSALQTSDTSNERCTVYVLQEIFSYSMYWCKCCISIQVLYCTVCRSIFMKTTKKLTTPTLIFSTMVLNCSHSNPMIDDVPPDRIIAHSTQYEFFCGSLHDYLTTTMDIGHKYARFVLLDWIDPQFNRLHYDEVPLYRLDVSLLDVRSFLRSQ